MDRTTTKVRIVFDCLAKTDGFSLNYAIFAGPNLPKDLFCVLIRFRRNPLALACDIKEMYLQVEIEERDRPYFRVLWRDFDSGRELDVYEFSRLVFGKNSAPMKAPFGALDSASRHQDVYPLAADTVLKLTLMDDSIASGSCARRHPGIQRAGQSVGNCRHEDTNNGYQILWESLQPHLRSTELLSLRLLWDRNLFSFVIKLQVESEVGMISLGAWSGWYGQLR